MRQLIRSMGLLLTVVQLIGCGQNPAGSIQAVSQETTPSKPQERSGELPIPKIIEETVFKQNFFYGVRGTIFNPTDWAMKNIEIKYYLFKSHMGGDPKREGVLVSATGGLVIARIKYLPVKVPVPFIAYDETAPTGGRTPELSAEITAEWE